jgi:hypothetical protein
MDWNIKPIEISMPDIAPPEPLSEIDHLADQTIQRLGVPPSFLREEPDWGPSLAPAAIRHALDIEALLGFQQAILAMGARTSVMEDSLRTFQQKMESRLAWKYREGSNRMPKIKRHFWERP